MSELTATPPAAQNGQPKPDFHDHAPVPKPAEQHTNGAVKPIAIEPGQLYINGQWRDSSDGKKFDTINPATEEVITHLAQGTAQDANDAAEAASRAYKEGPWGKMKGKERAKYLHRIADLIEHYADELAFRESTDMGKLYRDVTHVDIPHIANMFRYFAGWTTKLDGSVKNTEGIGGDTHLLTYTRREPLGVVAAITPYNFPLILTVSKIAPALAAGNCFIHKPASLTPLTAVTLAKIMHEAGLPAGAYNLVTGPGGAVGDALTKNPLIDKIAFTGSTPVGQGIMRGGADTMKHLTMELGGKSPNIVFADADLDKAVGIAVMAIFWNKGEVCVAGSRCLVEASILDQFVEKLVARVQQLKTGDPFDPTTDMGPMSGKGEYEKVLQYIEYGHEDGGKLVVGGNALKVNGKGYFVEPTVFVTDNKSRIAAEEIFGPVLSVIPFKDFDEAIRLANDSPYGLASGVQTKDLTKALRAAEKIEAGTVWINTWHQYDPSAPFGGYKMSGYGREHGIETFESYTQTKTIWANLAE
ncbi:betaine-aldehyde dehydrogenase [Hymenobacter amundsenii]|uniref:Betaine-aldehyde dehydrogenase n=1 Tax=Hymenobacter amundsenii TaxID=2006685 RepID=A0A246FG44_9BACT|nr:aldehyde dehydrogenase family protein [Hymenobacter amundsenii]OWP61498.1 betaine-aldehyde dehydrogenase [Hymenobacter amundsenii]